MFTSGQPDNKRKKIATENGGINLPHKQTTTTDDIGDQK